MRDALTAILHHEGYETAFCATIEEARSELQAGGFCLLLLDLQNRATDLTAIDWLQDFLTRGDAPRTLIVSASRGAKEIAERFGIPFMKKPFDIDALVLEIMRLTRSNVRPSDGGDASPSGRR